MGERPVVVTTEHRGVFFGYFEDAQLPQSIKLSLARNCIHWSSDVGGFLGLASEGPSDTCSIGAQCESLTLFDITSVAECTREAAEKWRSAPTC